MIGPKRRKETPNINFGSLKKRLALQLTSSVLQSMVDEPQALGAQILRLSGHRNAL